FRGSKEIDDWLNRRRASFEAAVARLPHDEKSRNIINNFPHAELRSTNVPSSSRGPSACGLDPWGRPGPIVPPLHSVQAMAMLCRSWNVRAPLKRAPACAGMTREEGRALSSRGKDDVGRLLGDHIDRAGDEKPRDPRKDRGIDDAQTRGAIYPEVAVQHPAIGPRPDRTAARGMVAPGAVAHEIGQRLVALQRLARLLLLGDQPLRPQ